jgi:hypothetical protein
MQTEYLEKENAYDIKNTRPLLGSQSYKQLDPYKDK